MLAAELLKPLCRPVDDHLSRSSHSGNVRSEARASSSSPEMVWIFDNDVESTLRDLFACQERSERVALLRMSPTRPRKCWSYHSLCHRW